MEIILQHKQIGFYIEVKILLMIGMVMIQIDPFLSIQRNSLFKTNKKGADRYSGQVFPVLVGERHRYDIKAKERKAT